MNKGTNMIGKNIKGKYVVVRCYAAGVHMGTLVSRVKDVVELKDARRLYRWRGANTLSEVSQKGVNTDNYTRISEMVPQIVLTGACEVIPTSDAAKKSLDRAVWSP